MAARVPGCIDGEVPSNATGSLHRVQRDLVTDAGVARLPARSIDRDGFKSIECGCGSSLTAATVVDGMSVLSDAEGAAPRPTIAVPGASGAGGACAHPPDLWGC